MSKSLGNGIDPLEIIDKYGADSLRISLVLATPDGQDPWISKNTFEIGRNFINKLYQVSRFLKMKLGDEIPTKELGVKDDELVIFDRWILSRLERTIENINKAFDEFRLSSAAKTLYNFVWDDFCSWYIELIKPDNPEIPIRKSSLNVATYVLHQILTLLHPLVPFVTEEIFQDIYVDDNDRNQTITFGPWPEIDGRYIDEKLEESLKQIQDVVTAVRSIRAELNVPPGKKSDLYIKVNEPAFATLLKNHIQYFRSLARVENLHCGIDIRKPPFSASAVISGAEIFVPLSGLIDIELEKKRLQKNLADLQILLEKISKKLANPDFLANAPKDVIDREKLKKEDYQERSQRLNKNLEQIIGW